MKEVLSWFIPKSWRKQVAQLRYESKQQGSWVQAPSLCTIIHSSTSPSFWTYTCPVSCSPPSQSCALGGVPPEPSSVAGASFSQCHLWVGQVVRRQTQDNLAINSSQWLVVQATQVGPAGLDEQMECIRKYWDSWYSSLTPPTLGFLSQESLNSTMKRSKVRVFSPENISRVSLETTGGWRASSQILNSQVSGKWERYLWRCRTSYNRKGTNPQIRPGLTLRAGFPPEIPNSIHTLRQHWGSQRVVLKLLPFQKAKE